MEFSYIGNQDKKDVRLAGSFANGAFVTANSAASFANAAFARANAAYAQANTGGNFTAAPVSVYSDEFTANGATTTFNLSTTPTSENYIIAVVDGITQLRSTYTVTGNVVAFDTTFENGANVEITTITGGGAVDPYASNTANAAYATANAAFLQANTGSTDTWVRTQANTAYDKANSAASFANGSFVVANSASIFANASFDRANAAYAQANNSTDTWVRGQANNAYDTANSAGSFANGAFITANSTAIFSNAAFDRANSGYEVANSSASFANGAFGQANSAGSFANGAFVTANSTSSFANGAFLRANSGYGVANSGASFANGAFTQANTAVDLSTAAFIQANAAFNKANTDPVDSWGRTQANTAYDTANAAFIAANNSTDTWVRTQSNSAFNAANSSGAFANAAFDRANAAYAQANTAGGADTFARAQANAAFSTANLAYNTIITASNTAALYYITRNFTGDGNTNTFSISSNTTANSILIFDNGITQNPLTDYSVTGNTISFVEAPANGSIIQVRELLSNVPVVTDNSNSAFDRANSAYATANAAFTAANNSTDSWVRGQANNAYDSANSAGSFANAAFVTANSAASFANGAFDRANLAASFANGAFVTANSAASFANGAFSAANTKLNTSGGTITGDLSVTGNLTILGTETIVNTNQLELTDTLIYLGSNNYTTDVVDIGIIGHYNDGTNAHAGIIRSATDKDWYLFKNYTPEIQSNNTIDLGHASFAIATLNANLKSTTITLKGIDLLPYVNNAYATANSGSTFANSAFVTANASYASQNTTASFANGAFITANASYNSQNTTASFANGAFITANAAFNAANNATDPWVRNQANNAYNTANAAFTAANTAGGADSFARAQANAAFDKANTNSGGTLTGYVDAFTGDGSNSAFTLSTTPADENIIFVSVQGVMQPKTSYSLSGNILTFDSVPPNTAYIEVTTLSGTNISSSSLIYRTYTGNNTATNFTVTSGVNVNNLLVAENGILQRPTTDYTVSGANVVFATAPATGVDIQVRELVTVSGGNSLTWYIANANTTTVTSSGYFVDTTVGPITMTLPASATLGDTIRFNDLAGTFSANNLTIARNSHKIQGIAADLTVDVDQTSFGLVYSNTTYGWKVLEL
jgi:hypothetical protein